MVNKKLQRCGLILLVLPLVACAEVFQWTDQQGQPHYSDQAGNNAQKMVIDAPPTTYYQVEKVFDGDTILLSNGTKVRFLGINTPEVAGGRKTEEQGGQAAKVWLKQRLEHKKVSLQFDVEKQDQYQRSLAYVFDEQKRNINLELVKNGLAAVSIFPPNLKYLDQFLSAQQSAESAKLGIWAYPQYASKSFQSLNQDNYHGWQRITGTILAVKNARKYHYLQFSEQVALQVPDEFVDLFPDLQSYVGKTIEARGWVHRSKDRFALLLRHPGELKRLN